MVCPPVRGDNPQALTNGFLPNRRTDNGITVLYHPDRSRIFRHKKVKGKIFP